MLYFLFYPFQGWEENGIRDYPLVDSCSKKPFVVFKHVEGVQPNLRWVALWLLKASTHGTLHYNRL